mmetsp:Transcript_25441/g.41605  ORF Transcript_25441/g.41605 Transcript_25441/m.41605 type:complete len:114 (-) Transcript_25441:100-441(-)
MGGVAMRLHLFRVNVTRWSTSCAHGASEPMPRRRPACASAASVYPPPARRRSSSQSWARLEAQMTSQSLCLGHSGKRKGSSDRANEAEKNVAKEMSVLYQSLIMKAPAPLHSE